MPSPPELGRGAIVLANQSRPYPAVVKVDRATLASPDAAVDVLHRHWSNREPATVVLDVDPSEFRRPADIHREPYTLAPAFLPQLDRLHFLVWNNNVDLRTGEPVWWWSKKAVACGAKACPIGEGDVLLSDGRAAWIDGGPRDPRLAGKLSVVHSETLELGRLDVMPEFREPAAELAPDQLAAVAHAAGPARIIAPAGSGKTRVLTERLTHLIRDRGYEPSSVLALAYNKRAQQEMESRVSLDGVHIRTLNSIALEICSHVAPGVSTIDERDVREILEPLLPKLPYRANTDPMAAYLEALSTIRLGLRSPRSVEDSRDDVGGIADAFGRFRAELKERNSVDFDEQIYAAVEALLHNGALRRNLQQRYRHILVDEFQDLRPLHLLMVRLLAAPQCDVFGVGDDDQVLYGYDGATPRFLIGFDELFPGGTPHALTVNYRCPEVVVSAAGTLLTHNQVRIAKTISPGPGAVAGKDALDIRRAPAEDGAKVIVDSVHTLLRAGADPGDIAILARVNAALLVPQVALQEAGIDVQAAVDKHILNRAGTRSILAYLRIGHAPAEIAAGDLAMIAKRPHRGLTNETLSNLEQRPRWSAEQLARVDAGARQGKAWRRFVDDIRAIRANFASKTTAQVMRVIRDTIGLQGAMELLSKDGGTDKSSHLDDLDAMARLAEIHPAPSTFEQWLQTVLARPSSRDGILLATVHRVKGQEWDHVILCGADDSLMPHRLSADLEEERRIFHVAITRCRKSVLIVADKKRPSPFLTEMFETYVAPVRPPHVGTASEVQSGIVPEVGTVMSIAGGFTGTVTDVSDTGVSLRTAAGGTLSARFGETVTVDGVTDVLRIAGAATPSIRGRRAKPTMTAPSDDALFAALKAWRLTRARADDVPAFIVFADKVLAAICEAAPATLQELSRVSGVGPTKLDLYGDEVLEVIAERA